MFRKGQSTLEYALMIAVVIAVIVVMQKFLSGGIGGRLKTSVDDIGEQFHVDNFNKTTITSYPAGQNTDVAVESFGHQVNVNAPAGTDIINPTVLDPGISGYEVKEAAGRRVNINDQSSETWAAEGTIFQP